MKLALGISLMSASALIVLYGILMGVMVSGWKASAGELGMAVAIQTQETVLEVVNATLDFIEFAARAVPHFQYTHDPATLMRSFAAFNEQSGYTLSSFGTAKHANASHPPGSKVSWEVAVGYGCTQYAYAFSNNQINPAFFGYCGDSNGTIDFGQRAYSDVAWKLSSREEALLNGTLAATFLRASESLSYLFLWPQAEPKITFATMGLTQLSHHITSKAQLQLSRVYVYETETGALVVTNDPTTGAPNTIHNSSIVLSGRIVTKTRQRRPGLDWTVLVAVSDGQVYGNIEHSIVVASCAGLGVLAALVLILWISIYFCVNRQLEAKNRGEVEIPYTVFDDLKL
jgi:hypothetical protein